MFFNKTSYMDGPVGVTQWCVLPWLSGSQLLKGCVYYFDCKSPIPPGETFRYEIDTSLQHGTYWIHAHYLGQVHFLLIISSYDGS